MSSLPAQAPQYFNNFQCLGTSCEDTCCQGWNIDIDQKAYQRLKSIRTQPLADAIQQAVIPIHAGTPDRFARLQRTEQGHCQLLDSEQLCSVHKAVGPSYLSTICREFPRAYRHVKGQVHAHASVACPEVARMVLLNPQALSLESIHLPFDDVSAVPFALRQVDHGDTSDAVEFHAGMLHQVMKALIELPLFDHAQALVVGSVLIRRILQAIDVQGLSLQQQRDVLASTVAQFLDVSSLLALQQQLQGLEIPRAPLLACFHDIANIFLQGAGTHPFADVFRESLKALCPTEEGPDQWAQRYQQAHDEWVAPYLSSHPHALKNYVLNNVLKTQFPQGNQASLADEYLQLCERVALLKLCLTGICAHRQQLLDDQLLVKITYQFARHIEHHGAFLGDVHQALRRADLTSLGMAAVLLG